MTHDATNLNNESASRFGTEVEVAVDPSSQLQRMLSFNSEDTVGTALESYTQWHINPFSHSDITPISLFKERVMLGNFTLDVMQPVSLRVHSLSQNPSTDPWSGDCIVGRAYITSTLLSYTRMMMSDDDRLPPFIHPNLCSPEDIKNRSSNSLGVAAPEPLAVCSSIMRMYAAKSSSNSAFIWRTIQLEQQKIELEVCQLEF
jgi:hypothetical protein